MHAPPSSPPSVPLPARREFMTSEASVRGLRCAEAIYPAGMRLEEHVHERPSMTLIAGGDLLELGPRGRRATACDTGMIVVRPAGEPHADAIGGRGVINVELDIGDDLLADHALAIDRRRVFASAAIGALGVRLRRAMRAHDDARSMLVEGLALEMIALSFSASDARRAPDGRTSASLRRAYERIRAEFRSKLSIAALAKDVGWHPVSFARAFRARYALSPGELMRRLRIEWAQDELAKHPDRSIAAIALDAGFHDHSHFTRVFAKQLGRTPTSYRRTRA